MRRTIRFAVVLPLALIALVPVVVVYVFVVFPLCVWDDFRWKRTLRRNGRYRNKSFDIASIDGGTLIVDEPKPGKVLRHCWWTPDSIRATSPVQVPSDQDREDHWRAKTDIPIPFDAWCFEQYLHPQRGTALLLAPRRGDRYATQLIERVPNLERVDSWSAPVSVWNISSMLSEA